MLVAAVVTSVVLANAEPARATNPRILADGEGDAAGSHVIKADPQTGSSRLGAGLQRIKGGQGIPLHKHDGEDEILFDHSGSGVGVVGGERKRVEAGATLYVPQGAWHAIEADGEMEILWVVSPPHFAEHLRATRAAIAAGGTPSSAPSDVARDHGFRDGRYFFLPRLAVMSATLAVAAALVTLPSHARPYRTTAVYGLGAALATVLTMMTVSPGYVPPAACVLAAVAVAVAVAVGALGATAIRLFKRRLTGPAPIRPTS